MIDVTYNQSLRTVPLPSIEYLRARFTYDPHLGKIIGPRGAEVGSIGANGYSIIAVKSEGKNMTLRRARLAFALQEGRWPYLVDHINRVKDDDRWCNLREASQKENCWNARTRNIRKKFEAGSSYGFRWEVFVTTSGENRQTSRRNFCEAWKLRKEWTAERASFVGGVGVNA